MARVALMVRGMDCAEEVATLRAELSPMAGVRTLSFDVLNGKMSVEYDEQEIDPERLKAAVARTGMTAETWLDHAEREGTSDRARVARSVLTGLSGLLLGAGFVAHGAIAGWPQAIGTEETAGMPLVAKLLYLGSVVAGAWFVAPKAYYALRRFRPDMNLLMCVAVAGAVGIGEYFEAAAVSFLFALSLALEAWSVGRARRAIAALLSLSPTQARVMGPDNNEQLIDAASVAAGTTIVVKPGEKFPLDGRIAKGETTVNQAPITGESVPVPKRVGSEVFAGTINEDGAVEVVTLKPYADSTLAQIIKMVGEAQAKRAPSEQWVERFARVYTPAVMCLALAIAVVPPLVSGEWSLWLYRALVLLVIACPCALVISTPVSIVAALVASARQGVLIKGGLYVETPATLKALAFDKTGTLTEGRPSVQRIVPRSGHSEEELLRIAAAIEARSEHPLARAIVEYAAGRGFRPEPASDFRAIKGKGASAVLDGRSFWIGSHRFLEEQGQETEELHAELEALASSGASVVVIGEQEHVCGYIALSDRVREEARQVVARLKAEGVSHLVMLTGDNRGTAEAIGRETGVDEIHAELLPQDKVTAMEDLVRRFGAVAMVGDGVNDAPALARATLGIAMGAAGTDAALETADVALMGDDVSKLPWLIRHSRRTLRVIRQNIVASLGVKVLFVALTFAGYASLWGAIAADTGMSLLVVFNALRLLRAGEGSS
jgi:Cd2+/Zn2+-exporting ATPase